MSIENMNLISIIGDICELDKVLDICCKLKIFHPETNQNHVTGMVSFASMNESNPYKPILNKIINISENLEIDLDYLEFSDLDMSKAEIIHYIDSLNGVFDELNKVKLETEKMLSNHENAIMQLNHLISLDTSFDDIFACRYIKVRFGKIPVDSYSKLKYYEDKAILFIPFDNDNQYFWGVYFCPEENHNEIDEIMSSIFFERMRIPDYAHGLPQIALSTINRLIVEDKNLLRNIKTKLAQLKEDEYTKFKKVYSKIKFQNSIFEFKKYVFVNKDTFYLSGFVPSKDREIFVNNFDRLNTVNCVENEISFSSQISKAPVKLSNGWFSKPFEMFVNMYGLPAYGEFDPTKLFAITYTLLFGIMFGDLAQGAIIFLIGLFIAKSKKNPLGKIFCRVGVSSMVFGVVYGSVFGIEDLLDPFYQVLGFDSKPIHVFDNNTTNIILIASVGIGVVALIISIIINICMGIKTKDHERAFFGPNGVSGLVLYTFSIVAAVLIFAADINVLNPIFITLFVVIPLISMFFRHPLAKLFSKHKKKKHKTKITEFITENVFELFEFILSYITNTMSFLRIGGFVLSHAGMMAVVITLSEMMSGASSIFVLILGNLFVIAMEGMIVGIQVLRLEFYEIFSRFFKSTGTPFEPMDISYKIEN